MAILLDVSVPLFRVYYFLCYIIVFLQNYSRCVAFGSVTGGEWGLRESSFLLVYHNRVKGVLLAWAAEADMMAVMGWEGGGRSVRQTTKMFFSVNTSEAEKV